MARPSRVPVATVQTAPCRSSASGPPKGSPARDADSVAGVADVNGAVSPAFLGGGCPPAVRSGPSSSRAGMRTPAATAASTADSEMSTRREGREGGGGGMPGRVTSPGGGLRHRPRRCFRCPRWLLCLLWPLWLLCLL